MHFSTSMPFFENMKLALCFISLDLIIFSLVTPSLESSSSFPSGSFLGIDPQGEIVKCKNGSTWFFKNQLNDDFCDCPDGTDEPGTAACPQGKFYCRNVGHLPSFMFSSRVNDGICDCCDGSDEYDGKVKCPNTCWEAGEIAMEELKRDIILYRKGVLLREKEIEKVKRAISKDKKELLRLKYERRVSINFDNKLKDVATPSHLSWVGKMQETAMKLLHSVNLFRKPVANLDTNQRQTAKLHDVERKISSLTQKLKLDFGIENEFYLFYYRCFALKQDKYMYNICPFEHATQEDSSSSKTQLGNWEKFGDSYRMMLFSNGSKCWNGPGRSLKVKLSCGLKTELTGVDEPSRCEYEALMYTPIFCHGEKLEELEQKLKSINRNRPQNHDEL